jgi:hypothetical protein
LAEAEAALQEVIQKDSQDAEAIANSLVLNVILGKNIGEVESLVSIIRVNFGVTHISVGR